MRLNDRQFHEAVLTVLDQIDEFDPFITKQEVREIAMDLGHDRWNAEHLADAVLRTKHRHNTCPEMETVR